MKSLLGVLVAISIPIFTTQLEKSRDAVTIANLRSAYAEAAADALTADDPTAAVEKSVVSKGTQDGFNGYSDGDLPFAWSSSNWGNMDDTPNTYTVSFTFNADNTCTVAVS